MTAKDTVRSALERAEQEAGRMLATSPSTAVGSCTISSAGWSECKSNITKEACAKQEGPGVTVTWTEGGSC